MRAPTRGRGHRSQTRPVDWAWGRPRVTAAPAPLSGGRVRSGKPARLGPPAQSREAGWLAGSVPGVASGRRDPWVLDRALGAAGGLALAVGSALDAGWVLPVAPAPGAGQALAAARGRRGVAALAGESGPAGPPELAGESGPAGPRALPGEPGLAGPRALAGRWARRSVRVRDWVPGGSGLGWARVLRAGALASPSVGVAGRPADRGRHGRCPRRGCRSAGAVARSSGRRSCPPRPPHRPCQPAGPCGPPWTRGGGTRCRSDRPPS
jgi:hypothetical protein